MVSTANQQAAALNINANTVNVTGSGRLTVGGAINVGTAASATDAFLNITAGGQVFAGSVIFGTGSIGRGSLSGTNSMLTTGTLTVGNTAAGELTFGGLVLVNAGNATIGTETVAGTVTVADLSRFAVTNGDIVLGARGTLTVGGNSGRVETSGALTNGGTVVNGGLAFVGTRVTNTANATLTNSGLITAGTGVTNAAGATIANNGGGSISATTGDVANSGTVTNASGATIQALAGNVTNASGATITNAGNFFARQQVQNSGQINNSGVFRGLAGVTNASGATITNSGSFGTNATFVNSGTITNTGSLSGLTLSNAATGTITNAGTVFATQIQNAGQVTNTGSITSRAGLTNALGGTIENQTGGVIGVNGAFGTNMTNAGVINNASGATIETVLAPGDRTSIPADVVNEATGVVTNAGTVRSSRAVINSGQIINTGTITATTDVTNNAGATLANDGSGSITAATVTNTAGGTLNSTGAISASTGLTNAGMANMAGTLTSPMLTNSGTFNVTGNLDGTTDSINNEAGATLNLTGGNFTGIGTLTNAGTLNGAGQRTLGAASFINGPTGIVSLVGNGSSDGLTMTGSYNGAAGSQIRLDTALGNTSSPTDRIIINGNVTGTSSLVVTNVGGTGGLTVGDGIKLVQVDGTSAANAFTLSGGRINVGAFSYQLFNGGLANPNDQDWYLRSRMRESVAPMISVGRVSQDMGLATLGTFSERGGDGAAQDGGALSGMWGRAFGKDYTETSQSAALGDTRSNGQFGGMQMGLDLFRGGSKDGGKFVFGLYGAGVWSGTTDSITAPTFLQAGQTRSDGIVAGAYMTYRASGWYVDTVVQGGWYDHRGNAVDGASFSTKSNSMLASVEMGTSFGSSWKIEPQVQLIYNHTTIDNFSDSTGTSAVFNVEDAVIGRAGFRLKRTWDTNQGNPGGLFSFYAKANVWSTLSGGETALSIGSSIPMPTEFKKTWTDVGVGTTFGLGKSAEMFADADVEFGIDQPSTALSGRVGVRIKF